MKRRLPSGFASILSWALAACCFANAACERGSTNLAQGPVPSGAFALVGTQPLSIDALRRVRGAQEADRASKQLIDDAHIALEASAVDPALASVVERGVLARGLLESLREQGLKKSPPTEQELSEARAALWAELDRPRSVRTVNIMAEVPPMADGQREERLLRKIAEEVRGAPTPEELNRRVQAVPTDGIEVAVLLIPPVTEDGRVYVETPADAGTAPPPIEYARAAAALNHVGETSDVVATPTGYHVLMALDILPARVVSEPARSERLRIAVADRRVESELEALWNDLSKRSAIWQSPHSATLTSLVWRAQSGP